MGIPAHEDNLQGRKGDCVPGLLGHAGKDPGELTAAHPVHLAAIDEDRALLEAHEGVDRPKEGGLPRAVRTDDPYELSP